MASADVDRELETLIRARYPIIYIVSWEEKRVEDALRAIAQARGKKIFFWTTTQGMVANPNHRDEATKNALNALDYVMDSRDQALFVLKDYHPYIGNETITRRLRDLTTALKTSYKTLIILSPQLKLPPELEKEITVVDYGLPDIEDLDRILEGIIQAVKDNPQVKTEMTEIERDQILKAAQGLTAGEAENVMAKSLVEKGQFDVDVILGEKEQIIRKSGILEYYPFNEQLGDVGGLDLLKDWMEKRTVAFTEKARDFGLPSPRGVLLLGIQGCGKSLSAKAIGALWRLPLLRLDVGRIFAGIVGSSEENMRKAIRVAESVSPCVAGDTRITLADGSERTIAELYQGSKTELTVLGMDENWRIVPVGVNAITRRAAPDLFTVKLKHSTLQATSNHLHPVLREGVLHWVRTDALHADDYVAVPRRIPTSDALPPTTAFLPNDTRLYAAGALNFACSEAQTRGRRSVAKRGISDYVRLNELAEPQKMLKWDSITAFAIGRGGTTDSVLEKMPEYLNTEIGYLLGLISSDGYLSRYRIGFVNTDLALHDRFASLLCQQFGVRTTRFLNPHKETTAKLIGTSPDSVFRPCFVSYTDNKLLKEFLSNVQAHLLEMPQSFLQAFIRGYFDGDGWIADSAAPSPHIVLTAKRKAQNQILRSILLRIGFASTNPASDNIEISGEQQVRRFINEIGSEHPCRRARMLEWLARPMTVEPKDRNDLIPVGMLLRQARQSVGMASHHFASASSGLMHRYEHGQGHPNRARLAAIVAEMETRTVQGNTSSEVQTLRSLADSPITWSPVLAVEQAETPEYVYDLVCDAPHTFIANNIMTHNCILWLDELEKGFSGTQSSGTSDGGTTSRVFGTFLSWMQDKKTATFVVATSNDVQALPPELLRKGRFDEIFFIDLPSEGERREIFNIHIKKRKRNPDDFDLDALAAATPGYSGAEIEAAVIEALYDSFDDDKPLTTESIITATRNTFPLSMTMRERIDYLREWAESRARPASSVDSEDMGTIERKLMGFKERKQLEGTDGSAGAIIPSEMDPDE